MTITGQQFIGNRRSAKGTTTFYSGNNNTHTFYEATQQEIDEAAQKAHDAFLVYRNFPGNIKAIFLETIASGIKAARNELLSVAMQETFLAESRLNGEINRTINQIKLFANLLKEGSWVNAIIDTAQPNRTPLRKPDIRQMQKAIGAIAVFGASNFPFAFSTAGGDTIAAFAAGCTVVYKAHPGHPILSEMVAQIIIDATEKNNMPDGIFSMMQAASIQPATYLVQHPLVKAIAFTGSFKGGKSIYDMAAKRAEPIPVYAEMGSINPVFILPEIMKQKSEDIAKALAASNMVSAGQFCTNPGIIIASDNEDAENFQLSFSSAIANANSEIMLTNAIHNSYQQNIDKLSKSNVVTLVKKGNDPDKKNAAQPNMFIVSAEKFISDNELHKEVFGPFSLHVHAKNKEELMNIAKSLQGQLTITIWGTENDIADYNELINYLELKAGRIIINNVPTGVEVTHAMMHGGPYPATTDSKFTSVGSTAIYRFTRPVCYQNFTDRFLPEELKNKNSLNIVRMINDEYTKNKIE
ncbi:MAG: aldehyde dehydrogenase (NADP(+)) [Parafilimonas sp.]